MQHNYKSISKLEVELKQLQDAPDVPSRPRTSLLFNFLFFLFQLFLIARPGYLQIQLRPTLFSQGLVVIYEVRKQINSLIKQRIHRIPWVEFEKFVYSEANL